MAIGHMDGCANGNSVGDANEHAPADAIEHTDGSKAAAEGREEGLEDTVEFRVMMAYATRRRPGAGATEPQQGLGAPGTQQGVGAPGTQQGVGAPGTQQGVGAPGTQQGVGAPGAQQGVGAPGTPESRASLTEQKKVRKNRLKMKKRGRFMRLFGCVRSHVDAEEEGPRIQDEDSMFRCHEKGHDEEGEKNGGEEREPLKDVVTRLSKMADGISFTPGDLETDGDKDSVEKLVGLLLREHGDKLNDEILKDSSLTIELLGSYSLFSRVIATFLRRIGLNPEPSAEPTAQIAVTCEVTSRLSALDTLPMNRVLGFGAKFLKDHYSPWVMQRGGYEEVFESEDDTDEEES